MNWFRRLVKAQRGTVAVEFALVLPVFLLLLFGVIELGSAWYYKQMLVSATREGARLASLSDDATNGTAQVVAEVNTFLAQASFPGTVAVAVVGADGAAGTQVRVTTTSVYQMPVLGSLIPAGLSTVTLSASTVMRHE